jgi:hypothetical protein
MLRQVGADAAAKRLFAQPGLEHAQESAALLVGDAVEGALGLAFAGDRLVDRMGAGAGIEVHRPFSAFVRLEQDPPFGMEAIGRLGRHPLGERLVEPEVVPPGHGHQVAEPLMRDLVRHDAVHDLPGLLRRARRVDQQVGLGVDDRPQFSIAPPKPPGTPIWSSLGSG